MPVEKQNKDSDWWRGAVIYEVYVRSFFDSNADGVGDIRGITEKINYIADLGVDALWITPFFPSPFKDFGYDISDYRNVDPLFGTLEDFDELVSQAHEVGLRVIIDQVVSHTSYRHPWFQESRQNRENPRADWYIWVDPGPNGKVPNNWLSVFGGSAWQWDSVRQQYYLHNFLAEQPDLNFHNAEVREAVLDTMEFWLERGVDGFRLDAVNLYFHDQDLRDNPSTIGNSRNHLDSETNPYHDQEHLFDKNRPENIDFLKNVRDLMDRYPGTATVGEVGDATIALDIIADYTKGNKRLNMCYDFEFLGGKLSVSRMCKQIREFEEKEEGGWQCWAFSNHDFTRQISRLSPKDIGDQDQVKLAKLLIGLLLSFRGSACLYQGEELGLTEASLRFDELQDPYGIEFWPEYKGRDGCRTPMPWKSGEENAGFTKGKPWLPIASEHLARAVDIQAADPESILNHYKRIIHWYRNHSALIKGRIVILECKEPIMAIKRENSTEKVVAIFNLSLSKAVYDLLENHGIESLTGHGYDGKLVQNTVHLPGYSAFFGNYSNN